MYIFEFIIKKFIKKSRKKQQDGKNVENDIYEKCEHVFFPIDSAKDYLACSKCGYLVRNPSKNFFVK